jgi:catechol 2,3-dioxygenase-like lactoylglutathione lyase family enzyme
MITTLERVGYPPLGETLHVTAGLAWAGARVAYVRDPDGALVELVQRPESHNLT